MSDAGVNEDELVGIPVGTPCDKCGAPHSAIGGRHRTTGRFLPLFQEKRDLVAAAKMIGKLEYCGPEDQKQMVRVKRIVCTWVDAGDCTQTLVCQRCAREVAKALAEEGAAA